MDKERSRAMLKKIVYMVAGVCLFFLIGPGTEHVTDEIIMVVGAIAWAVYALS